MVPPDCATCSATWIVSLRALTQTFVDGRPSWEARLGVVGAFAITDKIFVIALGLGIGAAYIRALTVFLVRKGTLDEYIYLEHGAHWAIGALAVLLFVSIHHSLPQLVTGLIGVGLIAAAFGSSIVQRRANGEDTTPSVAATI